MFDYKNELLYISARGKLAPNEIVHVSQHFKICQEKHVHLSIMISDELASVYLLEIFRTF